MKIRKLNEWKCDMDIDDVYVKPEGVLGDMIDHFGLRYNPHTESYDCDGDIDLYGYYYGLDETSRTIFSNAFVRNGEMTIKFGTVKGYFHLPGKGFKKYVLTSLIGSPETVGGDFYCNGNQLTSLEDCPKTVGGNFNCNYNQLTSLKGCPESVGGYFNCSYNKLTSLEGCPEEVGGDFDCCFNQLTSLEGCPKNVGGGFDCSYNQLTSLEGCPKNVEGGFDCGRNQLTSLEGCPKTVSGHFYCGRNKTKFTKDDVTAVCNVKKNIYII